MSIAIFQIKKGAPSSLSLQQDDVMAEKPETGQLKHIGYFKGQNSIFLEDIDNKDIKQSTLPEFKLNQTRNKCELRFDDRDTALLRYIESHPGNGKLYERYSELIENTKKLSKTDAIEKALDYIRESDELRIRALGLAVLGLSTYGKNPIIINAQLKDTAISKPKLVIDACEDDLFEDKFIAGLAICAGIVKTNSTMTAIIWSDNGGRLINIATGEDFITKFAKHLAGKSAESKALRQELGNRLDLSNKAEAKRTETADEIAALRAKLAEAEMHKEIAENKLARKEKSEQTEPTLEELAILEIRDRYVEVIGKNVPIRYQNDAEWLQNKITEKQNE